MTARIVADQTQLAVQRREAQLWQAPATAPMRAPVIAPRIGVKTFEARIRNRTFKIKKTACTTKIYRSKKKKKQVALFVEWQ